MNDKNWIEQYTDPKLLEFKRPNEIFGNNYRFLKKLRSGNINQGSLGDCYFMVVIASLSAYPERIYRIFNTKRSYNSGL